MILVSNPFFLIRFLKCKISFSLLTKESATQSTLFSKPNKRSLTSFSVTEDNLISLSGKLTPFLCNNIPPLLTSTLIFFGFLSMTFNSILPSSISILSFSLISFIISLSILISLILPTMLSEVM